MREVVAWKDKKGGLHESREKAIEEDMYFELTEVLRALDANTLMRDIYAGYVEDTAKFIVEGRKEILKVLNDGEPV